MDEIGEEREAEVRLPRRRPNPQARRRFLENYYAKGMCGADAYLEAGYRAKTRQVAHVCASKLLAKLSKEEGYIGQIEEIQKENRVLLKAQIRASIRKLVELRETGPAVVQLKAAQDLLDRAGMGATQRHEIDEVGKVLLIERRLGEDGEGEDDD